MAERGEERGEVNADLFLQTVRARKAGTSLVPPWPALLTNLSSSRRAGLSAKRSCFWGGQKKSGVQRSDRTATGRRGDQQRPGGGGRGGGSWDSRRANPPRTAQTRPSPSGLGPRPQPLRGPDSSAQGSHPPFWAPPPLALRLGLPPGDPEPAPVPSPTPTASRAPTPHLRGALQLHLELRQLQGGLGQGLPKALVLTAQLGVQLRAQEGQGVRLAGRDAAGLRGRGGWLRHG